MRLAHTNAAVQEERVVGARWALRHCESRCPGELVAVADHKIVEGVTRIQLCRGGPIKASLFRHAMIRRRRRRGGRVSRQRAKAAVLSLRRDGRIFVRGHEDHVVKLEALQIDRFLNQVAILVADMLKLGGGNTHVKRASRCMTVTCGLEPRLIGLADDFFLEGPENLKPWIECRSRRNSEYHPESLLASPMFGCNGSSARFRQCSRSSEASAPCRVASQNFADRPV